MIALIDNGANPYDAVFRGGDALAPLPGATDLQLAFDGEFFEDDRSTWESIKPGVFYHFVGTRLYAISMDKPRADGGYLVMHGGHGAHTSFLAARDATGATIIMVQATTEVCSDPAPCSLDPQLVAAMEWIAEQPWIDIVSVSLGYPGNPPIIPAGSERYVAATERAVASGKIVVNGGGNSLAPAIGSYTNGPPWIICVGGAEPDSRGESAFAAKTSDVVANFSELVPIAWEAREMEWQLGTSLATPIVAATLASALAEVWRVDAARSVSPQELRDALNASAMPFAPTDWRPTLHPRGPPEASLQAADLPVLAPGQIGWGYVDASLAPEIARRILEGDLDPPPEKQQIALFQAQWQAAREAYWGAAR